MAIGNPEIEVKLRELKPYLMDKFNVSNLGYFGSFTTGKFTSSSDVDILVEFSKPIGLKFFSLEEYLENVFKRKVDLVTKNALREPLRDSILQQVIYV
jgi:predicted nucleotidyltransferase